MRHDHSLDPIGDLLVLAFCGRITSPPSGQRLHLGSERILASGNATMLKQTGHYKRHAIRRRFVAIDCSDGTQLEETRFILLTTCCCCPCLLYCPKGETCR